MLGVDLGSRRIGLALSDPGRHIASPHSVLQRAKAHTDDHRA
ncbi:MAG TPA: Holliday junction resolvase RuvX, partial [Acidimicrobiia bacterium]